jgi:hypothetical protein
MYRKISKAFAIFLLYSQTEEQSIPNTNSFPSSNSYPYKLVASSTATNKQILQDTGYVMKNSNGDKVFISILYNSLWGQNLPLEFHRAIVPASGGPVVITRETYPDIYNNNSNRHSFFFFRKLKKVAIISAGSDKTELFLFDFNLEPGTNIVTNRIWGLKQNRYTITTFRPSNITHSIVMDDGVFIFINLNLHICIYNLKGINANFEQAN